MKFREIVGTTNIDFIGMRNKTFMLSLVLVLLGLVAFVMISMGKANLSVDFTGGVNLQVKFLDKVAIGELRSALLGQRHSRRSDSGSERQERIFYKDEIDRLGKDKGTG